MTIAYTFLGCGKCENNCDVKANGMEGSIFPGSELGPFKTLISPRFEVPDFSCSDDFSQDP